MLNVNNTCPLRFIVCFNSHTHYDTEESIVKNHYKYLALLLLITSQAFAEQYVVHLDTSKSPDLQNFEELSIYGDLYTIEDSNGLTTTLLGPYEGKKAAKEILDEVHVAGHYAAYVSEYKSTDVSSSVSDNAKHQYSIANFDVKRLLDGTMLEKWNMLTPQQQASITYLNGSLQVLDGDEYVTLKDYTTSKVVSRFN